VQINESAAYLPLLEFDAVVDRRTSEQCRNFDKVIKPIKDVFWSLYYPPNHFGCRSTVRQRSSGAITATESIVMPDIPDMFKTNLAAHGFAFPPGHPYYNGLPESFLSDALALVK
jgi:uncharacterized protein with gpF-like domain